LRHIVQWLFKIFRYLAAFADHFLFRKVHAVENILEAGVVTEWIKAGIACMPEQLICPPNIGTKDVLEFS
jgi:hypothetical protein